MPSWEAELHKPKKRTYAIRIFDPKLKAEERNPLENSELYVKINQYSFDDNDTYPWRTVNGNVWFDGQIAEQMIRDFAGYKDNIECLLVHCGLGESRAPAVAMAFNEIFGLGQNTGELLTKYPKTNRHVYETLRKTAERLGIIKGA